MATVALGIRMGNLTKLMRNRCSVTTVIRRGFTSDVGSKLPRKQERSDASDVSKSEKSSEVSPGWLSRLLVRKIDTGHESQSSLLSSKDTVYELQFDAVKPECMDEYLEEFNDFTKMLSASKNGGKLVGSWTVEIGDLDEAVHLWKFEGGYAHLTQHKSLLCKEKDFIKVIEHRKELLRSTRNQILLSFGFWPEIKPRDDGNIYELRSYVLKPGTMIEWGNNWAKGIKFRSEEDEAVAGFFSQIGDQNNVHHFWAYKSLENRKEVRESAWRRPGWDSCVAHTVPLIQHMTSRILIPNKFSLLK